VHAVADAVGRALALTNVDPERDSDAERERRLDAMSDHDRERLQAIDADFYDVYEPSMELCRYYARQHGLL
jgi:hypothetical protein